ncbi:hypothetical protein F183_A15810 [Bryobacterales bacterium F-183]|nr:hypothetical protein F183_A15810 [Bryobacterales bacterium F-183]
MTQRLHVVHPLSHDVASLTKALDRKAVSATASSIETESSLAQTLDGNKLDQILSDPRVRDIAETQIASDQSIAITRLTDRITRTFGALENIAHHLATVPGRKSLLWVSAAFPMVVSSDIRTGTGSPHSFDSLAQRVFRSMTTAGVSVYPIDARGLLVDRLYRAKDPFARYAMSQVLGASQSRGRQRGGRGTFVSSDPLVHGERDENTAHHDIMQDIAKRTGGRAFFDSNAVAKAALDAISDNAGAYTLGFYPAGGSDEADGKFHRLQVKLKGRDGTQIRHREGYFAAAVKPPKDELRRDSMLVLMNGPLRLDAIPLAVQCVPLDPGKARVVIRVDPTAITFRESSSQWSGELEIALLYLDGADQRRGVTAETLRLNLSAVEYAQAMEQGINYRLEALLPKDAKVLIVGVRDNADGRLGTVRVNLETVLP